MSTKTDASPPSSELESDVDTYLPHVDDQFIPRAAPPRTRQMSVRSAAGLSDLLSQSRRQSEASTVDNLVNLDHLGGPGKCGHLYLKYWSDKKLDPRKHVPDVDVKYKVYRISDFDQKRGSFYIDFVLMLDWLDPSLELADGRGANFKEHFWPKAELMNMTPDSDALDFDNPAFYPKHKQHRVDKDGPAPFGGIHRATITMKIRTTLFARLDYHQFPFDKQTLELTVKLLSVRIPKLSTFKGVRPKVLHPTRWRGLSARGGHELLPECDCLPEFNFIRLASKAYSSKYGPGTKSFAPELKQALDKDLDNESYYQDTYTLQLIMCRESISVLWNMCFSLIVIDVMLFTAHGIDIVDLADRLR